MCPKDIIKLITWFSNYIFIILSLSLAVWISFSSCFKPGKGDNFQASARWAKQPPEVPGINITTSVGGCVPYRLSLGELSPEDSAKDLDIPFG